MLIIIDRTNILDIVYYPRNKIQNFPWNECFCFPVETRRETYFTGIFKVGNTGQHQFPACKKRGLIFIDFTLLNPSMVIKLLHHPLFLRDGYLKPKITIFSKIDISYYRLYRANRYLYFSWVCSSAKSWSARISPSRMCRDHNSYVT